MATRESIPLSAIPISHASAEFRDILTWPFADSPFYVAQIKRLVQNDLPQRVIYSSGQILIYRDPNQTIVGFGAMDVCRTYSRYTGGKHHCYIPVLAVHPNFEGLGHGRSIVKHLADLATTIVSFSCGEISDLLFLDVYTANERAIGLYEEKCGFVALNRENPEPDPDENNEPYIVMAKKLVLPLEKSS